MPILNEFFVQKFYFPYNFEILNMYMDEKSNFWPIDRGSSAADGFIYHAH